MTPLHAVTQRARQRALAVALLMSSAFVPVALAQVEQNPAHREQVARELFDRGREQWAAADYKAAANLFAASFSESAQPGALVLLADCQEQLGKLQSAFELFVRGAQLADAVGDAELAQRARARGDLLASRIPQLELRLPLPLQSGLQVMLDGVDVPLERLNAPLPLDAGVHQLEARAPGYLDFKSELQVSNGPSATPGPQVVTMTLVAQSEPQAAPASVAPGENASAASVLNGSESTQEHSNGLDRRTLAWISGGAGLLAGVIGVFVYATAKADYDAATADHCDHGNGQLSCDKTGIELQEQARRQANWATVAAIVATAGLGTGLYAYVTSEDGSAAPSAGGIRYTGSF